MFTKIWIKSAGTRALKTIAQAAIAGIGTATVVQQVDWQYILSLSVIAGILSLLTSIVGGVPEITDKYDELVEIGKQILQIVEYFDVEEPEAAESSEEEAEEEPEIAGTGLEDIEGVG